MSADNLKDFMNADWKEMLFNWWKNLSPVSKKSFIWIFSIVNLVFLWHTITFFFGNHDWGQIKHGVNIAWSLWDGRWGAGIIQQITGGDILPVWNNLFCFSGFTLAVIFLAKYWDLPKNTFIYTIFGLFIILMPYTSPWLQYVRSETHFWNVFLIVIALTISSYKRLYPCILAFLCLFFCLGCYAAMLPAIFIIFFGRCVLDVWFDNKDFKQLIKDRWQTALVAILAVIAFFVTWSLMKKFQIIMPLDTVDTVDLSSLLVNFKHIGIGIKDTFLSSIAYIPTSLKILFGLAIPMVIVLMSKKSKKNNLLLIILFSLIILLTQTVDMLSNSDYSNILRIDFWTMPYVYALLWTILLRTGKCWENLAILFMCAAIYCSGLQCIRDQKVKYFDKQRDIKIYEDVITRIKANEAFNPSKEYNVVIIGETEKNDISTTFDKYNSKVEWNNIWVPFIERWNAKEYFDFYEKESYVNKVYADYTYPLTDDELLKLNLDYLLNNAAPYPNKNSISIDENNIYIIFTQDELDKLREHIITVINNRKE